MRVYARERRRTGLLSTDAAKTSDAVLSDGRGDVRKRRRVCNRQRNERVGAGRFGRNAS